MEAKLCRICDKVWEGWMLTTIAARLRHPIVENQIRKNQSFGFVTGLKRNHLNASGSPGMVGIEADERLPGKNDVAAPAGAS